MILYLFIIHETTFGTTIRAYMKRKNKTHFCKQCAAEQFNYNHNHTANVVTFGPTAPNSNIPRGLPHTIYESVKLFAVLTLKNSISCRNL